MAADFSNRIYYLIKQLFPDGRVQVLVWRPVINISEPIAVNPAVRLVCTPSGIGAARNDFPSQIENFVVAAIRLRIACGKHGVQ
jgi:hypothetical protein